MTQIVFHATERTEVGSAAARRLRRQGRVPCIVCGHGAETQLLSVDERELETALRHHARVVEIETEGGRQSTLIKDIQYDTYGETIEHVDFLRVVVGETLATEVGLDFYGTPKGVTEDNGVLSTPVTSVEIECIPSALPSSIEVDVRKMMIGDRVRIADIVAPEGVVLTGDPEIVVAMVQAPLEEEEESEVPESAGEPEIIGGKLDEE